MTFAKEMIALQEKLTSFGHSVSIPCDADLHADDPNIIDDLERDRKHLVENDIIKTCFNLIAKSDAVVFLNLPKNGVDGYIGTSSLMEMGLAYYLDKKIFLMHPHPDPDVHRWAHEVASFAPTILNEDLAVFKKSNE